MTDEEKKDVTEDTPQDEGAETAGPVAGEDSSSSQAAGEEPTSTPPAEEAPEAEAQDEVWAGDPDALIASAFPARSLLGKTRMGRSCMGPPGRYPWRQAMEQQSAQDELRNRMFKALVEAVVPLKAGPDAEALLPALIQAAGMLKEHLEQELDELRLEQVE